MYKATTQREIIFPMAVISFATSIPSWSTTSWFKWFYLTILTLILLTAFIKYTLAINEHTIVYTINLFGIKIYSKQMVYSDIKKVVFKRANWKSKLAIIKTYKGFSIRVTLFKPETVYSDLITFCERNKVDYEKTKDYMIIEKMG